MTREAQGRSMDEEVVLAPRGTKGRPQLGRERADQLGCRFKRERTMLKSAEAQPHMKEAADIAKSYEPVLYTLRYADGT